MATLVIRFPDGRQEEHPLAGEATVGRADGNDLVLSEGGVSRRHARFFVDGAQVMVEDLGSANGTFVDGEQIEGPTAVRPGAQVVLGDYEISVKAAAKRPSGPRPGAARRPSGPKPGADAGGPPPRGTRQIPAAARGVAGAPPRRPLPRPGGAGAAPAAEPGLRGLTGPWANKVFPIRGTLTVGRVAGVSLQLEDESVSRRHAEVERTPGGAVVRDLGSANGTTVNGEPTEGDVHLKPGDVVQFGMVELAYEAGDEQALAAPTRRGGTPVRSSAARRAPAADAQPPRRSRRLLVVAGALVSMLVVFGGVSKLMGGDGPPPSPDRGQTAQVPVDPKAQVEQLLSECRSYSSTDLGVEPRWDRARAACEKARALDPINSTVLQLLQKIELEEACAQNLEQGRKLMNLLREEEALVEFGKIKKDCSYYRIVKPQARQAIMAVKQKAAEDCKMYSGRGFWDQALPRCELYMTFACQNMSEEQLHPPPGFTVDLWGGKCRKNCWRPRDAMYLSLLKAREKKDPNAAPWLCPPTELFREELQVADPRKEVEKVFKAKFKEPAIREAMQLYWDGNTGEAVTKLHRLRNQASKAEHHREADELRRDIDAVQNIYRVGSGFLSEGEIEKAAENFKEVLILDEKLLGALAKERPGFFRRAIETEMADQSYKRGVHWADRGDFRRGCRFWKVGFAHFRGHPDLNRAVGACSNRGAAAFNGARSCEDLAVVLDYAVEGDGLAGKVDAQRKEWACP